jgi:hypothetical protein
MKMWCVVIIAAACLISPVAVFADTYGFTLIASGGPFGSFAFSPSINNAGTVAFRATLKSGVEGIFIGNGGPITTIADTSGSFWWFSADYTIGPSIDDAGRVAFYGLLRSSQEGVFVGDGAFLTTIASGPFGSFSGFFSASPPISVGQVAFRARLGGSEGIYRGDGG